LTHQQGIDFKALEEVFELELGFGLTSPFSTGITINPDPLELKPISKLLRTQFNSSLKHAS
jgi:hypothetical protein